MQLGGGSLVDLWRVAGLQLGLSLWNWREALWAKNSPVVGWVYRKSTALALGKVTELVHPRAVLQMCTDVKLDQPNPCPI